jgi:glycosyltransferase involved in cell wall biosynthesis
LCEAFDDFDCIVIPTVYLEAFGLVALEAQSRGLPVISSDLDSLKEVMGEAALYFKAGCSHSLAGTLKLLAEDHDLREELSLKARASSNQFRLHRLTERISIYSNKADERE